MTMNGKEVSKKNEKGCRKKIKLSLYLPMVERYENDKRNGESKKTKETTEKDKN